MRARPLLVVSRGADAQRNCVRLLETAKAAFAGKGTGASLDEIAPTTGGGAGTLYLSPMARKPPSASSTY